MCISGLVKRFRMKKRTKNQDSSRKRLATRDDLTPTGLPSVLFNYSNRSTAGSVVVPETPNNSFHHHTADVSTVATTVLETPDTPASFQEENKKNDAEKTDCHISDDSHMSETAFEDKLAKCAQEKLGDESVDEESSVLDITPELNLGRRRNVMSILESEHSFAQSLFSQGERNSSMITVNKPYFVSPVKRRTKRRSLAEVILPFDLNDDNLLSKKLQAIQEVEERPRRLSLSRQSVGGSGSNSTGVSRRGRGAKSRMSLQFSSLKIQDATSPKCVERPPRAHRSVQISREENNRSENNSTKIFENEDLEMTAVCSVNQSLTNMIMGRESQNREEIGRDSSRYRAKATPASEFLLPTHCQKQSNHENMPTSVMSNSEDIRDSCDAELLATQPASILILQGA